MYEEILINSGVRLNTLLLVADFLLEADTTTI